MSKDNSLLSLEELVLEAVKKFAAENPVESEVGFDFEYTWIVNPWLDETGRVPFTDSQAVAYYGVDNVMNFIKKAMQAMDEGNIVVCIN